MENDCGDALWRMRLIDKLSKLPIDPPPERPTAPKPDPLFYCNTCDSQYCTCKKEKKS